MTLWKWMISTTFAFVTCAFLLVPAIGQSKTPNVQTQPVQVVNSAGQPVPTAAQGTTNVAGTVGLAAGSTVNVGNTPNVNVANTPSVNVTNTPTVSLQAGANINVTNPLDSQNNPTPLAMLEAMQPYEDHCTLQFAGSGYAYCLFQQVPSGKRLVIQEFDAKIEVNTGLKPLEVHLDTAGQYHYFPTTFLGNDGSSDWFASHQETRLYVQGGHTPDCEVVLSGSSNGFTICVFSGFLVDQ